MNSRVVYGHKRLNYSYMPCGCLSRAECLQLHYDLELCHLGAGTDANTMRCQRREWQRRLNTQIQNIALELVVNIFRYGSTNIP